MTKQITSVHNDQVKYVRSLLKEGARRSGRCIVEGLRAIEPFLASSYTLETIFFTPEHASFIQHHNLEEWAVNVTHELMKKLSSATTPSGLLAVFGLPERTMPDVLTEGTIVLARISDPGNMGTLIRTAAAVGRKTVVVVEGCDPWNPKAIQASAGSLAHVAILGMPWSELVARKGSLRLCALTAQGGESPRSLNLDAMLLVVGSEAHGIPEQWLQTSDARITLPMPGGTESLNAAVAGSIALYMAYIRAW